jgi:hypothetical protein
MSKYKYPKSDMNAVNELKESTGGAAYIDLNGKDKQAAFRAYGDALEHASHNVIKHSEQRSIAYRNNSSQYGSGGNSGRDLSGLTSYIDGKPGLRSSDFDWFRPGQAAPTKPKDIIAFARFVYRRVGLIHNAMDLMGDFSCQGIRIVHPNPNIQKFMRGWAENVDFKRVSERIGHLLFREANVPIRHFNAKINNSARREIQKSVADTELNFKDDKIKVKKNEIPWKYTFLDPLLIDPIGGPLANLSKKELLSLKVPRGIINLVKKIQSSNDPNAKKVLDNISPDILKAIETGKPILLPPDKTDMLFYKKDDWDTWADPITYSAFEPLNLYQRLFLADKAALDSAQSKVRVWRLGSLEHGLAPTATSSEILSQMLGANVGGGLIDIVWGPDIDLIETDSDLAGFLGEEKYRSTLMALYATLGIPPTLTGTFGATGTTNNFISLKTLTERLNYVRDIIVKFWREQMKLVQEAMGFRQPSSIEVDYMYLEDPAAVAQLLLSMADRNIVSDEFVQNYIKADSKVEETRLKKEKKNRERDKTDKVSPYHTVDQDHGLKKMALQTGQATPSEVGVELEERKPGEKTMMESKEEQFKAMQAAKPKNDIKSGGGPGGRPKNKKDSKPRKEKTFKPKTKAAIEIWAKNTQKTISDLINPVLLQQFNKKDLRSLTANEFKAVESMKFEVLCNLSVDDEITNTSIAKVFNKRINNIHSEFASWIEDAEFYNNGKLTVEQVRDLRATYYVHYKYGDL